MQNQIQNLFVDNKIPSLGSILRDETPYGVRVNGRNADGTVNPNAINAVEYTNDQQDWWTAAKMPDAFERGPNDKRDTEEEDESDPDRSGATIWNNGNAYDQGMSATGQRPRYGNPSAKKWKAHGPTQSPFFNQMPGINPTANPLTNGIGTLDEYYRIWIEFAESQDSAQCALIPVANRVKCMENFDALVDKQINGVSSHKETSCYKAGCCFNEDQFLETGGAACYRATNYGSCINLPEDYIKEECGVEGISESECLTNVNCCYKPSADRKDPWCFKKYSATLREDQWCDAWSDKRYAHIGREECFATKNQAGFLDGKGNPSGASNVNNLVPEAQCLAAGCCYDNTLDVDVIEWYVEGLGYVENKLFRCFMKKNPMIAAADFATNAAGQKGNVNKFIDGKDTVAGDASSADKLSIDDATNPYVQNFRKTCDVQKWGLGMVFKRSCGENLSYYQCVYVNKCCYKPTVANEPACYRPELSKTVTESQGYKNAADDVYKGE
jgi:hypothetical protein